ncbi:MAG: hypothetical protein HY706_08610 [Candidatus Hydrogenedentes bacterium]|nr:hypothetical protein [Candidatus Hydrogenedentota bacterium]
MLPWLHIAMVWIHLLAMGTALGVTLALVMSGENGGASGKLLNSAVGFLLLTGALLTYVRFQGALRAGVPVFDTSSLLIAVKLLLLIALGAFFGIAAKKGRAGEQNSARGLYLASLAVIALASLLGLLV